MCEQSEHTTAGEGHPSSGMMCHLFPQRGEGLNVMLKVRVNDNLRRHPELCLTAFAEIYDFEQNVPMRAGSQEIQKPGSQPALDKMLKHGGQSDVQHDINLFLKRTYSPIHLFTYLPRKRPAFTLAEVLITLGIIGVVAALAIPTLLENHRKQVVTSRLQKFYTTFNQAVLLAENKYGEIEYWDNADLFTPSGSGDWFNKYLAEFFTSKDIEVLEKNNYTSWIKLADGSAFGIRFGIQSTETNFDMYFFPNASDIAKCMVNTLQNTGSCCGRKYFTFHFTPQSGLKPYGYQLGMKRDQLIEKCRDNDANYCTAIIMLDGWKISNDYPKRI